MAGVPGPQAQSRLAADTRTERLLNATGPGSPATVLFNSYPVNLYMVFLDGNGTYRLDIWNGTNIPVKTIYEKIIITQKDDWGTWDGTDSAGIPQARGTYFAVLSKDGRALRKVVLSWVKP